MDVEYRKMARRLIVAVLLSLVLVSLWPSAALGSAPWLSGCSQQGGSNYLCIYRDSELHGSVGHMAGSNSSYVGETYPSSDYNVDNSVSSMMNLYSSKDVTWHWNTNNSGTAFCLDSNVAALLIGTSNDKFSSHQVAVDDSAC
jgi:hypothetical protein